MPAQTLSLAARLSEKLVSLNRWPKVMLMVAADCTALPICFFIAMLLRLGEFSRTFQYGAAPYIAMTLLTIVAFMLSGLYRAVIRFIDQPLLVSAGIGLGAVAVITFSASFSFNDQTLPRSAVMIYWFTAFTYVVTSRLVVRSFLRKNIRRRQNESAKKAVAIYGAGEAGVQLAQAMRLSNEYQVKCFFDDKQSLNNKNVASLTVYHSSRLATIVQQQSIGLVILAIPSSPPERRRQVMRVVRETGVGIKTLHSLMELADEKISTKSIREIKIEDLLGRAPIPPRVDLFARCVQDKSVLVTGTGGSIGSELCRQIMGSGPAALHLLDHSEFALYTVMQELKLRFPDVPIYGHLGSVCDARLVEHIVSTGKVGTIYHAAAYKHVPLVEANMAEGIRNNVLGAKVVAEAATKFDVKTCVLVSTDKAVRPTNIMGASKRVAELIFQAAAARGNHETVFSMVRFGNVLGSSGSVVPLFREQIERGGPITITHPDIARYFMLIPEAAQLVIQAGAMAKGGEIFVLDMGELIKIIDLARTMIEMSGLKEKCPSNPHGDIEISVVGLRPGEKLYEELTIGDAVTPSYHPRIMCATEYSLQEDVLGMTVDALLAACESRDREKIQAVMRDIVPEYLPQECHHAQAVQMTSELARTEKENEFAATQSAPIAEPASPAQVDDTEACNYV